MNETLLKPCKITCKTCLGKRVIYTPFRNTVIQEEFWEWDGRTSLNKLFKEKNIKRIK